MPIVIIGGEERPQRSRGEQDYREAPDPDIMYREEFPEDLERFAEQEEERSNRAERRFEQRARPGKFRRISGRLGSR
jgi:hypothetical protein